jgi:hypothetical protein
MDTLLGAKELPAVAEKQLGLIFAQLVGRWINHGGADAVPQNQLQREFPFTSCDVKDTSPRIEPCYTLKPGL